MSGIGIEAVIARSRQPGGFSERKQFTVARSRGIQKLRQFALADPHFYILELIQSSVANGAQHIDIKLEQKSCTLSYIGGGLVEAELGQLFDFLFASKDRTDIGHVRELALGLNAVLLFAPDRVIVESGDGTLAGTTRMVMHGDSDQVEVGRADRPLTGTYVHIEGMKRSRVPGGMLFRDPPRERGVIEEKCLAAPIPIIVNHESLFGYASQRTPGLFGYRRALSLDEGDLYGTIGIDPSFGKPSFQLLTRGVSIQSKEYELLPGQAIGGTICFDTLRKTVDHSGIVEDERLEEMWVRLRPYARQLVTGVAAASPYETTLFGGDALPAAELRRLLREHPRVVVVPPKLRPDTLEGRRALAIGHALGTPILAAPQTIVASLRALGGGEIGIVMPDLSDRSVSFYQQPRLDPPARPWLASPVEVEPLSVDQLARRIAPDATADTEKGSTLRLALGDLGRIEATVYTPQERTHPSDGLWVWISTTDRLVSQHIVPSPYPGHVLLVRLPDTPPSSLSSRIEPGQREATVADDVAQAMAEHAVPALSAAFDAAVRSLGVRSIEPGTVAAGLGLAALSRSVVPRLRAPEGQPTVDLVQLEGGQIDLLELPLLQTLAGRSVCMRDVTAMMDACGGLLYGTVPSVPAAMDGLDLDRVLELDEATERLLVTLFGEGPYVRIDRRDVLASFRGVQCRDLALGLRAYPDFPLLVEGEDPTRWTLEEQLVCERALVSSLVDRVLGLDPPAPEVPVARAEWEECRRQACRHLQWYVCRRALRGASSRSSDGHDAGVDALPLFLDVAGEGRSFDEVHAALRSELVLLYGHALGSAGLGALVHALEQRNDSEPDGEPPDAIVAGPWIHRMLAPLGKVRLAFDFDLPARDRAEEICESFLTSVTLEDEGCRGRVGVPTSPLATKNVPVILPDNRQLSVFADLAVELDIAGWVRLEPSTQWSHVRWAALAAALRKSAHEALGRLIDELANIDDSNRRERYLEVLLAHAGRHLSIFIDPHGRPQINVTGELVGRILSIPVFPSRFGGVVSGWRLLQRFCGLLQSGSMDPATEIANELRGPLPPSCEAWIRSVLTPANVVHAPTHDVASPASLPAAPHDDHAFLSATLDHWLARLRPDPYEARIVVGDLLGGDETLAQGVTGTITLNREHWLVGWALRSAATEPQVIAWLLLAIYAQINHVLEPVDNDHERVFQRRVLEAARLGALRLIG